MSQPPPLRLSLLQSSAIPADERASATSNPVGRKKRKSEADHQTSTTDGAVSASELSITTVGSGTTGTAVSAHSRSALVSAQVRDDMHSDYEVTTSILSLYTLFIYYWIAKKGNGALADASIAMSRTNEADRNKHLPD